MNAKQDVGPGPKRGYRTPKYKFFSKVRIRQLTNISDTQPDNELESLEYYRKNARQFLFSNKIQQQFGPNIVYHISQDEDALYSVMFGFMKADWKHKKDGRASRNTLRYMAGIWSIKSYIINLTNYANRPMLSMNHNPVHLYDADSDEFHARIILQNQKTADTNLLDAEYQEQIKKLISVPTLDKRAQQIMYRHFLNNEQYGEIGKDLKITKQRVYQIVVRSLELIKAYAHLNKSTREYWEERMTV